MALYRLIADKLGTGGGEFVHRTRRLLADRGPVALQVIFQPFHLVLTFSFHLTHISTFGIVSMPVSNICNCVDQGFKV